MDSLPDLLAERGMQPRSFRAGHSEKLRCPKCNSRDPDLSLTINADGESATWLCHRGKCGWHGGVRVHRELPSRSEPRVRTLRRPTPHTDQERAHRPDWLYEFFAERHIGARTVDTFEIYAMTRVMGDLGQTAVMVFPYRHHGEIVNRKFRPFPAKHPMSQESDALPTLFNSDALGDAPVEIVWVEGEPDVMALFECGIPNAVTLKDGAPKEATFKPDDRRFEALRTHSGPLLAAKKIILAGDMDGPGLALREELARRLGRHRCHTVTWPEGCKDACDTLREQGPDAVTAAIAAAQPYPIDGLQRIKIGTLSSLRARPAPATLTTGVRSSDLVLKLPSDGRLIVVTGFPSHGKTSWTRFVMVHTASNHGRRWAVFSPEHQPWEHFAAQCAEVYCGKPFYPDREFESMSIEEITEAEIWLSDRVTMLVCDAADQAPTLEWIIECATAAVLRDGVTDLLIDPWNEIDHQRGTMTETDYIGRALQLLKAFALRHGVNAWIVAHPAKPPPLKPGERRAAPGPYDLAGSAHWANKTDLGITLHAPQPGGSELHVWKTRFRQWGRRGAMAALDFNEITGRYSMPVTALATEDAPQSCGAPV